MFHTEGTKSWKKEYYNKLVKIEFSDVRIGDVGIFLNIFELAEVHKIWWDT